MPDQFDIKLPKSEGETVDHIIEYDGSNYLLTLKKPISPEAGASKLEFYPVFGYRNDLPWLCGFLCVLPLLENIHFWQVVGYTYGKFAFTNEYPLVALSHLVAYNLEGIKAQRLGIKQADTMKLGSW